VTFTAHRHDAEVWTMTCWLPAEVNGVTALPDAADEVTAGVDPGAAPLLTTKIWKAGVAVGTGTHWNAHPMFQEPPAMVNAGLVQSPACWTSGTRMDGGANTAGGVEVVVEPAPVVEVEDPTAVVVVAPEAPVVEVAVPPPTADVVGEPAAGGSLYPPPDVPPDADAPGIPDGEPALPLNHIPSTAAITAIVRSCQVFQDRRSLIFSSPISG
jgi:hypothetical protein